MQLEDVGRQGLDDALERVVVGVDAERAICARPRACRAERARRLEADMAWALREKDEADDVRASVKRGFERRGVERPQILTIGVIAASFGQSARAVKGRQAIEGGSEGRFGFSKQILNGAMHLTHISNSWAGIIQRF